jgi:hypothetical protein
MIGALAAWHFDLAQRLGGGGYAQAYRCDEPAPHPRPCAIKVFDDPYYANTFERELAALQAMRGCPGTLTLVDHGRDGGGRLCIVTELVPGVRLDKLIAAQGSIDEAQLRAILVQLLAVLRHAHAHGWLHKDIKASNVLVDGDAATLIDWGVAEPLGDGRAESIRAKQDYVAPECFHGRHGVETDLYSLGWLVVEALTGAPPYHCASVRERDYRVAAHCLERPELPASLPDAWRSLALAWIARDPAQRLIGYDLDVLLAQAATHVTRDRDDAVDYRNIGRQCGYLEQAARAGVPYAQHELAMRQLKDGRHAEALRWLECAVASGYATAAFRLARILDRGEGCSADPARARQLLEAAATAGNAAARYRLARQLQDDDEPEAAQVWLKQAADAGYARAQYEYARQVEAQSGDLATLVAWLGKAADRGYAPAQARLTRLLDKHAGRSELADVRPFWEQLESDNAALRPEVM